MKFDLLESMLENGRWATSTLLEFSRGLTDAHLDQHVDVGHETLRQTFGQINGRSPSEARPLASTDPGPGPPMA